MRRPSRTDPAPLAARAGIARDRLRPLRLGLALALLGCDPAPPVPAVDAGLVDGPGLDRGPDAAPVDAAPDVMPDVIVDAVADAMPDAMPDAAVDAMPDVMVDATPDAAVDAMVDAAMDATVDAAVDALIDADVDAMVDAAVDALVDATPDAADAEVDAEPDLGPPDGPAYADDFADGPLARYWRVQRPDRIEVEIRDGALHLVPRPFALWFDRSQGPLIHQPVTGDFRVTARVRARRVDAPDLPPDRGVQLGGLLARDPQTPPENHVGLAVGHDPVGLAVEARDTVAGRTDVARVESADAAAALRICRLGPRLLLYHRPIDGGGPWLPVAEYAREGLPATLQVGLMASVNLPEPDLRLVVEDIAYDFAADEADCLAE